MARSPLLPPTGKAESAFVRPRLPRRRECRTGDWSIGRAHRERTGAGREGARGLVDLWKRHSCGRSEIEDGEQLRSDSQEPHYGEFDF